MINKIINWTLGGFFRTLGKFLLFLCIGILIALIFAKNDIKLPFMTIVHASETSGYGTAQYIDCSYAIDNRGIVDTDDVRCSNWINFGTEDTYPTNTYRYMYSNNVFITSGNYTWEKGNTYTITMTLAINPKEYDDFYNSFRVGQFRYEGGSTNQTSSLSEDNLIYGSSSIEISNISNNNYWVQYKFTFIPSKSLKSVWFQILYRGAYDGMEASDRGLALRDFQYYRIDSVTYVEGNDLTQVTDAINQQIANDNQNTQDIIDNQNQNTQDIIDNQNQNTQDIINANKICTFYDNNSIIKSDTQININGNEEYAQGFGVTDFIKIDSSSTLDVIESFSSQKYVCFYNINKVKISCIQLNSFSGSIDIPSTASYIRSTIYISANKPTFKICINGNQAIQDTLNDDDTSETSSDFMNFINNFTLSSDNYIAQILLLPINLLEDLIDMSTDDACVEWHGKQICFPNGQRMLWQKQYTGCHLNDFFCATNTKRDNFKNFINLVLGGFIIYKLLVKLAKTIENALDPTKTYVEVMKL